MAGKRVLTVEILGDAKGIAGAVAEADRGLAGFSSRMQAVGAKMRDVGKTMTLGLTLPIVGALGLGVKWAGELEDAQAMSQQVFGSMSADMDRWASNSAKNFGLSKGDAVEWANQMGIRLRQIGQLSEQEAGRVSQNLVQLAGDFASAFGGTVDEAAQALGSALTGEFEPLKRYGVVINDTALKAKYFQLTGEEVKGTLSAQQKQVATLALIQEQASIVQGDYARNADGATNAQRTMTAALKDAATNLGTVLLPYVTQAVQFVTSLTERFKGLSPTVQKLVVIGALVVAALGPVIYILGVVATAIGFIATPVGLVVAAIAALVAAFVVFYKTNEGFREWVNGIVSLIRDGILVVFKEFTGGIRAFAAAWTENNGDVTSSGFPGFMERVANLLRDITGVVLPKVIAAFQWLSGTALPAAAAAFQWFSENVLSAVVTVFGWLKDEAIPAVVNAFTPLVERAIPLVVNAFSFITDTVVPALVTAFHWVADNVVPVLVRAFTWIKDNVVPVVADMVVALVNGFGLIVRAVLAAWDWVWEKTAAFIGWFQTNVGPVIAAVVDLVSAVFSRFVDAVRFIWPVVEFVFKAIAVAVGAAIAVVVGVITAFVTFIRPFWDAFWAGFTSVLSTAWSFIQGTVEAALDVIRGIIQVVTGIISGDWSTVWSGILSVLQGIWGGIVAAVNVATGVVRAVIAAAGAFITSVFGGAWSTLVGVISGAIGAIVGWVNGLRDRIVGALAGAGQWLVNIGRSIIDGLRDGVTNGWETLSSWLGGVDDKVKNLFSGAGRWLIEAGKAIMQGLLDGLTAAWRKVSEFVGGLAGKIKDLKGPLDYDKTLLIPAGRLIMDGLGRGLRQGFDDVADLVSGMAPALSGTMTGSITAPAVGPVAATGTGTLVQISGPIHVDVSGQRDPVAAGKQFVEAILDYERVAGTGWRNR
jgi:phage-related protein